MLRAPFIVVLLLASLGCDEPTRASSVEDDAFSPALFANPPAEFGPQTRWWWPGASVDDAGLREQLRQFVAAGYSAVEIQPFMSALTNADLGDDPRIRAVGDATFLERLRTAACTAQDLGLHWDITLGSGWSTGGVGIDDDGARQLIAAELTLEGPASYSGPLPNPDPPAWIEGTNRILPALDGFDEELRLVSVLGAEVANAAEDSPATLGDVVELTDQVQDGTLGWDVPTGTHRVLAIYENRTQHFPAGGAYPGALEDARVIDHLDRRGVEAFLSAELSAWLEAVSDCPPRAVFVDSFELVGELPWTTGFGADFETSLGYDVHPLLPFLFLEGGESEYVNILRAESVARYRSTDGRGARAREDYEALRSVRFAQELIGTLSTWLQDRGIELRLQAHGGYADILDAYAMADVPESEGLYAGGSYDFLRLSASAAHVRGRRYVSSETFVSVGRLELSEQEARILMGRAFSAGINRLVHHGNAYPYLHQDGQRWFPFHPLDDSAFSTGPVDLSFDIHPDAPIWAALPQLNRMAARLSYALSRGTPVAEVAWLYPRWDAKNFANSSLEPGAFESQTSKALRRAGFSYDRISRSALASSTAEGGTLQVGQASYDALVVEGSLAAGPEMLAAIERAANEGVPVIWVGAFPERADGLRDTQGRDTEVATLVGRLRLLVTVVSSLDDIPTAIENAGVAGSLGPVDSAGLQFSVARRQVDDGDLYFLFNESYESRTDTIRIEAAFDDAVLFDPETGLALATERRGDTVTVTLAGARGVLLWVARAE